MSRARNPTTMDDITKAMEREARIDMANLKAMLPDPSMEGRYADLLDFKQDMDPHAYAKQVQQVKLKHPPLKVLPCANVKPRQYWACDKPGISACSACRLVSYCSKECQHAHWKQHKPDCKNHLRSSDWKPDPLPLPAGNGDILDIFDMGSSLWGNIPAIDIINLAQNEHETNQNFSLAFAASGDLRHVISTINALPESYSGTLSILLNDFSPYIVARNLTLLLILTRIEDIPLAADVALHFWYSVFLPGEHRLLLQSAVMAWFSEVVKGSSGKEWSRTNLVGQCSAFCLLSKEVVDIFKAYFSGDIEMDAAQTEYDRVREAPSRKSSRDNMYSKLRPSHRLAFRQYRRFGIILPHGAFNFQFNTVNNSLFSKEGRWLQTDYADPIEGWNLDQIVECGKRYGANPEDIYGCFYFLMTEQLQLFAKRLRAFKISFKVVSMNAADLPGVIRSNSYASMGMGSDLRFDRIEVSNIMDHNYVGIEGVISNWTPLLSKNRHAALLGYFMNWSRTPSIESVLPTDLMDVLTKMIRDGKALSLNTKEVPKNKLELMRLLFPPSPALMTEIRACSDHSKMFEKYLKEQNFERILKKYNLETRAKQLIGPHRIMAPMDGSVSSLPLFSSEDSYYYNVKLTNHTWTERFVEIVRSQ